MAAIEDTGQTESIGGPVLNSPVLNYAAGAGKGPGQEVYQW